MECPICTFEFDANDRKPLLCRCGNSICNECVVLIVNRNNNSFVCPLCKFHQGAYKSNPLTYNRAIQELMVEVDCLTHPTKEKEMLTEALIYRNSMVQASDPISHKEFDEYIAIMGLVWMLVLFFPWIVAGFIGVTENMEKCGDTILSALSYSIVVMVVIGLLWIVNSGNCIVTDKVNKRFLGLELSFLAVLVFDGIAADWILSNNQCYHKFPVGFVSFIGLVLTSFAIFSALSVECTARIFLHFWGMKRIYTFNLNYDLNVLVFAGYNMICYLGPVVLIIWLGDVKVLTFPDKIGAGCFCFFQAYALWSTFIPLMHFDSKVKTCLACFAMLSATQVILGCFYSILWLVLKNPPIFSTELLITWDILYGLIFLGSFIWLITLP